MLIKYNCFGEDYILLMPKTLYLRCEVVIGWRSNKSFLLRDASTFQMLIFETYMG